MVIIFKKMSYTEIAQKLNYDLDNRRFYGTTKMARYGWHKYPG